MHKNNYNARTLIGNWQEERSTEAFEERVEIAKSYLPNPSYNKFIPISKDIGNKGSATSSITNAYHRVSRLSICILNF